MESPVIVENCAYFAMPPTDQDETGFPFEDDYSFQDRLNNIAQRHPEFADQLLLDDFPSLRRKRNGSGSSDQDNLRFGGGPSSRFGTFNSRFPFSHHFEDEFANEPAQNRQEKPPEVPKGQEKRGRKPNPNLPQHLSNTVDLGQKQPPVDEARSQRSMSAPPENRSTQSSRVENQVPEDHQDMGKSQSRPSEPAPSQAKERIIPIHVEGRSEPVIPKNTHTHTHHANSGPPPEQVFGQEKFYQPQFQKGPDTFAKRQQAYEQYMPNRPAGFTKQSTPPHQQQQQPQPQPQSQYYQHYQQQPSPHSQQFQQAGAQQHKQATPPPNPNQQQPQQQQYHQQQQHQQQQQQQQQQRATPPPSNDPLDKIKIVKNDVLDLMTNVQNFRGTRKDREYLYLDEMLTRNLIKLDDIETDGKDNIRNARKEAIKCIQTCISNLEAKAQAREKEIKAAEEQQGGTNADQNQTGESAATQGETQNQNNQEQQTVCPPIFKTEATINLCGPAANAAAVAGAVAAEEQSSGGAHEQMQVEQQKQKQETSEKSADAAATQNDAAAAAAAIGGTPMEITEHQPESVQSNSSQPETTSK